VRLIDHYRTMVPDGLVNDRWLCWSPAWKALEYRPVRQFLDKAAAKAASKQGGLIPPDSPVGDIRTPEYVSFSDIRKDPWECVRGIDKSFGFNRSSRPEDFLPRDELLGMVADIASKGGNLLLNVGPRGEDAAIPDEQLERLAWLGEWTASTGDALYRTRPWVRPAATTVEGDALRFTARGEDVFAHVLADGVRRVTIPGLAPSPTTEITVADRPVDWKVDGRAIVVDFTQPIDRPAIRLHAINAR
jgi:alpha-L-fucosidase